MPEITITYNSQKTLKLLKELSKYLDFIISVPKSKHKSESTDNKNTIVINGVTAIRGTGSFNDIDLNEMNELFTKNNINALELRSKWQRKM